MTDPGCLIMPEKWQRHLAKIIQNGIICPLFGVWLRPVERTVRVREVRGSNPRTPTALQAKTPNPRESFCFDLGG